MGEIANAIRFLSVEMVEKANSGHPGMPLGMADVTKVLYEKHLRFNPEDPLWLNRDRFVLSCGHGSALLYSILYLLGYKDVDVEDLKSFRQLRSKTPGHPEYGCSLGVETSTGPLGQGLANAVGMAISSKLLTAKFGRETINYRVYVIVSDGCLAEGISQEALSLAGHLKLDNLIVLFDDNGITIDGSTSLSTSDDHQKRFAASGWNTIQVEGYDEEAIDKALTDAKSSDKPTLIACKTKIGYGAPTMQGSASIHGSPVGRDEIAKMREVLNWNYREFEVPDHILNSWRNFSKRNYAEYQLWGEKFKNTDNELKKFLERDFINEYKNRLHELKKQLAGIDIPEATRKSSARVINALFEIEGHNLIGGSADLTPSNNTEAKSAQPIEQGFATYGNYIHYGIREHLMAAAMNGISLQKAFIPFGGTFLAFSDYARPAIRLSALMKQGVIYVMTHDSIGLGEDGPTHQPVEHLAALRAIPNLNVFRPADIAETIECWQLALSSRQTPSILALSRQNLSQIRKEYKQENLSAKGAYIIRSEQFDELKITIFASGSEVEIAFQVADKFEKYHNIGVRVVSVPCFELFKAQTSEYQVSIMCNNSLKVAIEAGVKMGWERFISPHGIFFGVSTFGESAPAKDAYNHFGLTADNIYTKLSELIAKPL